MTRRNYFAENIKYLRKMNHLTQKSLADRLGKTANAVSNWEQGIRQPTVNDMITVCNYFDIEIMDLMEKDLSLPESNDPLTKLQDYIGQYQFADHELDELLDYARWIVNKRNR